VPTKKKPSRPETAFRIVGKRYPGLVAKIKRLIEDSEKAFAGNSPETEGSYLWEHTVHVASLAFKLAEEERRDSLLAAITALFHDAGKFAGGRYHADDSAEEDAAARLAEPILKRSRMPAADRDAILFALGALYRESAAPNPLAALVHDADFLSKFGFIGVAQFFVKSTLRGKTIRTAVMNSLSKELTYAACLPLNMRTKAGRALAARKSADTLRFYDGLLKELRDVHDLDFQVQTFRMPHPRHPRRTLEIKLVLPAACPSCGGNWTVQPAVSEGKKCRRLEASIACARCGETHAIAFCLPELAGRPGLA
jgi:HD superfamily phosphodiesterase